MSDRISMPSLNSVSRITSPGSVSQPKATVAETTKVVAGDRLSITDNSEPETRVSKELDYSVDKPSWLQKMRDNIEAYFQSRRADKAPGTYLCRNSHGGKAGIRQLREQSSEKDIPVEGLTKTKIGWKAPEITNPNNENGTFNPYDYMPNIVFDEKEDSFPILPDRDGSGNVHDDVENYKHGMVGGEQPLQGSFSVAKKGEYTVLTYSLFYPDNKFTNYHVTDSSTFAVYLKPDKNGKLQPDKVYTSWHYGANLSSWDELKKGEDGKPIIKVERGSHALHPVGKGEKVSDDGLTIQGDGDAEKNGKSIPNKMTWVTPNPNVENATVLNPVKDKVALDAYYAKYPERTHPIHPVLFEKGK